MTNTIIRSAICALGLLAAVITPLSGFAGDAHSSVWKVTKGGDSVIIGGTIHILPVSEFPLPEAFTDAYAKSDTLVFEAELPDLTDAAAQQQVMAAMMYKNGETLKDTLSASTYQALSEYFKAFGANMEQLSQFKPGFITTMMTAMEAQRVRMAGEGVDGYFVQLAQRDHKDQQYLETIEYQISVLSSLGEGDEDRMISESLTMMPQLKTYLQDIITAWRAGDTDTLRALSVDKFKRESPASFDLMFTERNNNWVPQIEAMFGNDAQEFVLVGTGHLVGPTNVLALLEAKGYTVEPF